MKRKPNHTNITALILLFRPRESAIENEMVSGRIASRLSTIQNETQITVPTSNLRLALN